MTDWEKILKAAKYCLAADPMHCPDECPYQIENGQECGFDPFLADVITYLEEQESEMTIVHCKDCIYRPTAVEGKRETYYVFPYEGKCPCQCDDDWYSWRPGDDWFCANGERWKTK